jgi:hypothetical protein
MSATRIKIWPALALVVLGVALAGLTLTRRSDGWVIWHEYGRWSISEDRASIHTERSALDCTSKYRVQVVEAKPDRVLLRLERRPSTEVCDLVGCVSSALFDCGVTIALAEPLPAEAKVQAVCEPEKSLYATSVGGGARPTLGYATGQVTTCSLLARSRADRLTMGERLPAFTSGLSER